MKSDVVVALDKSAMLHVTAYACAESNLNKVATLSGISRRWKVRGRSDSRGQVPASCSIDRNNSLPSHPQKIN